MNYLWKNKKFTVSVRVEFGQEGLGWNILTASDLFVLFKGTA